MNAGMSRRAPALAALAALLAAPATASADAPWPCFEVQQPSFSTAPEGERFDLDASCTTDTDGHAIVSYEWDVDGDGTFETAMGASPALTHTFTDRAAHLDATVHFGLQVTDVAGESRRMSVPVRITDEVNSWFTFSPQLVNPGDRVSLTATTSHVDADDDPAPQMTYAWDLDGDGAFETSTGALPTTELVAPQATGRHRIGLQVSDDRGNVSTVRREIEVLPRHPSRDMQPWNAPVNLGDAPVVQVQAEGLRELTTVAPAGPVPSTAETGARDAAPRRPLLKRISADRRGVRLRYTGGPRGSRWNVVIRLPADRAASFGLPRRTVVLARGKLSFDRNGVGTTPRMRWTKGAYRIFLKVRRSLVDIRARRIA